MSARNAYRVPGRRGGGPQGGRNKSSSTWENWGAAFSSLKKRLANRRNSKRRHSKIGSSPWSCCLNVLWKGIVNTYEISERPFGSNQIILWHYSWNSIWFWKIWQLSRLRANWTDHSENSRMELELEDIQAKIDDRNIKEETRMEPQLP